MQIICEPCIAGKQHRPPTPQKAERQATVPLERVHSDVHGPLDTKTPEGFLYWVTFIDEATRLWTACGLRSKSDTFQAYKAFEASAENQLGRKIKCLRDDKGGEYMSNAFKDHLVSKGVVREHTVRNEPHMNGIAERANRTLKEAVVTHLVQAKLPPSFWFHMVSASTFTTGV